MHWKPHIPARIGLLIIGAVWRCRPSIQIGPRSATDSSENPSKPTPRQATLDVPHLRHYPRDRLRRDRADRTASSGGPTGEGQDTRTKPRADRPPGLSSRVPPPALAGQSRSAGKPALSRNRRQGVLSCGDEPPVRAADVVSTLTRTTSGRLPLPRSLGPRTSGPAPRVSVTPRGSELRHPSRAGLSRAERFSVEMRWAGVVPPPIFQRPLWHLTVPGCS
jgi:hypothetical protein